MNTTRRKILSIFLCLTMLLGLLPVGIQPAQAEEGAEDDNTSSVSEWDGTADTSWYTENQGVDSYTISTAAQLAGLAQLVKGGNTFSGKTITLETDIDLNPGHTYDLKEDQWTDKNTGEEATKDALYQWTPIGTDYSHPFTGTFNGNNHTISGLYINNSADYQGLFGYVGSGGTVKDLTVFGEVTSGEVTSQDYVGGVVGCNFGTVENCTNSATVTRKGSSFPYVGGVVGYNNGNINKGIITNCTNNGKVTGIADGNYINVGGVVGCDSSNSIVENCTNNGTVIGKGSSPCVGGVVGSHYNSGTITNCTNSGKVTGIADGNYTNVGGVVGEIDGTITNCYNSGTVAGKGTAEGGSSYVGGVVGNHFSGRVENCYNSGTVNATGDSSYAGGVVGRNNDTITKCYYLVENESEDFAGIGSGSSSDSTVEAKTRKEFASGEVAWLLQDGQTSQVWGQNLSDENKDEYPMLTSDKSKAVYKVTFISDGSAIDTAYANSGGKVSAPQDLTKEGYTFDGWYSDENFTQKWDFNSETVTGSIILYAKWDKASYTVTFESNGGTAVNTQTITHGGTVTKPTAPTREGYTFVDWYSDEALTQPWNFATNTVTESITLYAKWNVNQYTVKFDSNEGSTVESQTINYGGKVSEPTAPTREGYTFTGWYSDEALTQLWDFDTVITGNITLYAKWTEIKPEQPSHPTTPSEPEKPSGPSTGDSAGWDDIRDEITGAEDGDTITIDMNGETEVPADIFEEVAGKDVDVVFDMGDGVKWEVHGTDIPADARFSDLDLGVSMNTSGIPVNVINAITGEVGTVQITLAHDGDFGFVLTLTAPLGEENAGYWANLYHYDEDAEQLNFETAATIDDDGTVKLRLTHASQYAIVIDDHSHAPAETTPVSDLFTDVAPDAWYIDAVQYVYDQGLMTGTSATTFEPNISTTRGMIVSILYRLEGNPDISDENLGYPFADVDASAWYADPVYWARMNGIVAGFEDGTFRPNDAITREQLAAILYNYAQWKGMDVSARTDLSVYTDQPSPWAEEVMQWAVAEGLISGTSTTTLDPQGTATRAQVAAILQRFLED